MISIRGLRMSMNRMPRPAATLVFFAKRMKSGSSEQAQPIQEPMARPTMEPKDRVVLGS